MSWNLLIYRAGQGQQADPMGTLPEVTTAFDAAFPGLEWPTPTECEMNVEGGFSISWTIKGEYVDTGYTNGGFNHLTQLAALCKKHGWRIADAQEGEDIDLDDPYASYPENGDT